MKEFTLRETVRSESVRNNMYLPNSSLLALIAELEEQIDIFGSDRSPRRGNLGSVSVCVLYAIEHSEWL